MASARDLQVAVDRMVSDAEGFSPLQSVPPVGGRPGAVAVGRPSTTAGVSTSADLVETDYLAREYYAAQSITSSDGLFVIEIAPIKTVALEGGKFMRFMEPVSP